MKSSSTLTPKKNKKTNQQSNNMKTENLSMPDTVSLTQEKQSERQTENSNNNNSYCS